MDDRSFEGIEARTQNQWLVESAVPASIFASQRVSATDTSPRASASTSAGGSDENRYEFRPDWLSAC